MGAASSSAPTHGLRLLSVSRNSPAARANLEPFFDFVVRVGDLDVTTKADSLHFSAALEANLNSPLRMTVYSTRRNAVREIVVVPTSWGGGGCLGACVAFDEIDRASKQGLRVLQVEADSPAAAAGLQPEKDFLLGSAEGLFRNAADFHDLLRGPREEAMELLVFNSDSRMIRHVPLKGSNYKRVGCTLGEGFVHQIPKGAATEDSRPLLEAPDPQISGETTASADPKPPTATPQKLPQLFLPSPTSVSARQEDEDRLDVPRPGFIYTVQMNVSIPH